VTHVIIEDKINICSDEIGFGSSYFSLYCETCKFYLGKIFKTTTSNWDHIRDLYNIDMNQIVAYTVGSSEMKVENNPVLQSYDKLELELKKIKSMLMFFHERISTLETIILQKK